MKEIATTKNVTPAQLALAWLLTQEGVCPHPRNEAPQKPGGERGRVGITLTREDLERIDEAAPKGAASGGR